MTIKALFKITSAHARSGEYFISINGIDQEQPLDQCIKIISRIDLFDHRRKMNILSELHSIISGLPYITDITTIEDSFFADALRKCRYKQAEMIMKRLTHENRKNTPEADHECLIKVIKEWEWERNSKKLPITSELRYQFCELPMKVFIKRSGVFAENLEDKWWQNIFLKLLCEIRQPIFSDVLKTISDDQYKNIINRANREFLSPERYLGKERFQTLNYIEECAKRTGITINTETRQKITEYIKQKCDQEITPMFLN